MDTLENAAKRAEYWKAESLAANKRITYLENLLFSLGAMENPPCFCCGYNGPGYFDAKIHECAKLHHLLYFKGV